MATCRSPAAWVYSQRLDGLQRGEEPLADGLQFVVIEGEQIEVLQVLERVHPQAVDLVGIEEAASTREAGDSLTLVASRGPRADAGTGPQSSLALLAAGLFAAEQREGLAFLWPQTLRRCLGMGMGMWGHHGRCTTLCHHLEPPLEPVPGRKAGDGAHVRGFLL